MSYARRMILVKDLLAVAYDAASLTSFDREPANLGTSAEAGTLLDRIEAAASNFGLATIVQTIPAERRDDVAEALGRAANAADYIVGSGWEAVVVWTLDLLPREIRDFEA